jgi:hypothetical protein
VTGWQIALLIVFWGLVVTGVLWVRKFLDARAVSVWRVWGIRRMHDDNRWLAVLRPEDVSRMNDFVAYVGNERMVSGVWQWRVYPFEDDSDPEICGKLDRVMRWHTESLRLGNSGHPLVGGDHSIFAERWSKEEVANILLDSRKCVAGSALRVRISA